MKANYTSRAFAELEDAYYWCEQQQEGLGDELLDELDSAIGRVEANPNSGDGIRKSCFVDVGKHVACANVPAPRHGAWLPRS